MYLVINKCVTAVKVSNFTGHYLRNHSTLDIGVWVISVYFNIRNTLPKSSTFLLGHPVYTNMRTCLILFLLFLHTVCMCYGLSTSSVFCLMSVTFYCQYDIYMCQSGKCLILFLLSFTQFSYVMDCQHAELSLSSLLCVLVLVFSCKGNTSMVIY